MSAPPPPEEKWSKALHDFAAALAALELVEAKYVGGTDGIPFAERIRHAVRTTEEYRKYAEETQATSALAKRQIDELQAGVARRDAGIGLLEQAGVRDGAEISRLTGLLGDANKAVDHWRMRSAAAEAKIASSAHDAGMAKASLAGVTDAKKILYNGIAGLLSQAEEAAADASRNDAAAAKEKLYGVIRKCKSLLEAK
jgi:chromosome segregation ATPase